MKLPGNTLSLLACLGIMIVMFVIVSLFDIVLAVMNSRFYSNAAFIVTFGVGGIFAGVIGYMQSISLAPVKNEWARWSLIILLILTGSLFFFVLAKLEGGEYESAFRAYGLTMALSSLLFIKGKVD